MRRVILIWTMLLPQPLKIWMYRRVLKWKIGKGVKIGVSYLDSLQVVLEDNVRIGHGNIIRNLNSLTIGEGTYVANFNEIFGTRTEARFPSEVQIGHHVNFMSHHFIDAAGIVTIGDHTTIGGRDTHFWSHTRQLIQNKPSLDPLFIEIGKDVYVGARATLIGCSIPDGAVVAAGSVVTKHFCPEQNRLLIAGNPATIRKRYERDETCD